MGFVQKLRTVRSGSLTGMTLDDIIFEVANMILENNPGAVSSVKVVRIRFSFSVHEVLSFDKMEKISMKGCYHPMTVPYPSE